MKVIDPSNSLVTKVNAKIDIVPIHYYNYNTTALMDIGEKYFDEKDGTNRTVYRNGKHCEIIPLQDLNTYRNTNTRQNSKNQSNSM